jgi:small subunit ribosomal protein S15
VCAAGPSTSRALHASAVVSRESAHKAQARRKRKKVIEGREKRAVADTEGAVHLALGSRKNDPNGPSALYQGSRLEKTVLKAEDVWYTPPPNYAAGEEPANYVYGVNEADRELLFGALPLASSALSFDPERVHTSEGHAVQQGLQSEVMRRILDLRNADKAGIEVVNRARIVSEFGKNDKDTGNTIVQAALITHQIREMWRHVEENPRDIHNRRRLRMAIHKRARVFKYLKRSEPLKYAQTLLDCGLEPGAVEGELMVGM